MSKRRRDYWEPGRVEEFEDHDNRINEPYNESKMDYVYDFDDENELKNDLGDEIQRPDWTQNNLRMLMDEHYNYDRERRERQDMQNNYIIHMSAMDRLNDVNDYLGLIVYRINKFFTEICYYTIDTFVKMQQKLERYIRELIQNNQYFDLTVINEFIHMITIIHNIDIFSAGDIIAFRRVCNECLDTLRTMNSNLLVRQFNV